MELIKQIYFLFDNFQDKNCRAHNGYNPDWRPNWNDEIENELNLIKEHSPISLPEDYCELFRAFGGGVIEDERQNWIIPAMTFWTWEDIKDFNAEVDFFENCPNTLPFGDDIGDIVFLYMDSDTETGIYMTEKSLVSDAEYRQKIANSFTELFTNEETQRLFRNYYTYGCDKGGSGR